jgi:hypothetical protein
LIEFLGFSDPHVYNAAVDALLREYSGLQPNPTAGSGVSGGGSTGGTSQSSPSQSGSASVIAGTYAGRVSASSWSPPDAYNDPAWFNITLTIKSDGSGSLSLGGNTGTFPAGYVQKNGDGTITIGQVPLSSGDTMELTEARIVNGNQLNANLDVVSPGGDSVSFDATYQDTGALRFVLTRQS